MTRRFAAILALFAWPACAVASTAQSATLSDHRRLMRVSSASAMAGRLVSELKALGCTSEAAEVARARASLDQTAVALRKRVGPPRLGERALAELVGVLRAETELLSEPSERRHAVRLLKEAETARAALSDRRLEAELELKSRTVRLEFVLEDLERMRKRRPSSVVAVKQKVEAIRRSIASLQNEALAAAFEPVSEALEARFAALVEEQGGAPERLLDAMLAVRRAQPADTVDSFSTVLLAAAWLRDHAIHATAAPEPDIAISLVNFGCFAPESSAEPSRDVVLRYRVSERDRSSVADVFARRLRALGVTQCSIGATHDDTVEVRLSASDATDVAACKRALAQRGSILLAWEARRKDLEAAGLRVDVNTFAKEDRPVPLFANSADPRRPPNPEASAAFCYYPAEQPAHPRGAPTPGCIVAVEPEATFADTDIALLSHRTQGFQQVVSLEMTESQRERMLRVTEARRGRLLCLIINDRLVSSAIVNGPLPGRVLLAIDGRNLIRTLVASHGAGVLTAAPRLISERVIAVADTVDFSLPPRAGTTMRIERTLVQRGRLPSREELSTTFVDESIHRVDTVVDGQVARATRTFETSRVRPGRGGRPAGDAMATPMQGAAVIVSWDGAQSTISVVRDGKTLTDYGETGQWARNRTVVAEMRRPVVPLGRGVHAVGESWSLDADAVLSALHGGALTPSADRTATARLVSVDDTPAGRVAHIDLRARIPVGSGAVEWTADVRYNVTHRVVVRCVAKGRSVKEGSATPPDSTFDLTATAKVTSRQL